VQLHNFVILPRPEPTGSRERNSSEITLRCLINTHDHRCHTKT